MIPSIANPWVIAGALAGAVGLFAGGTWAGMRWEAGAHQAAVAAAVKAEADRFATVVNDQQEIARHAKKAAESARVDARASDLHARQLRGQLAAVRAAHPPAACGGEAAGDAIGVLADVLERADTRARVLAEYADAARTAGQACERAYDALTRP